MRARSLAAPVGLAAAAGAAALVLAMAAFAAQAPPAPRGETAAGTRSTTTGQGLRGGGSSGVAVAPAAARAIAQRLSVAAIPQLHAASSATVSVSNFKFAPVSLTVNVGDTVTWVNHDQTTHTATASSGAFDVNLPAGASGSFRFTQAGTFDYICKIHPFMKASVTVTGAGSSGGSGGSTSSSGGGSGSGSGGSAGSSGSGSNGGTNPLPHTGVEVASMLVTGLALLGLGLTVRRGIRRPGRPPG